MSLGQLLEFVDLDFEPRWVTKDKDGWIGFWKEKPTNLNRNWFASGSLTNIGLLKLAEFDGKDWTECIYEVPRKTTGKIEKLETTEKQRFVMLNKINELVEAVNELKGAKND